MLQERDDTAKKDTRRGVGLPQSSLRPAAEPEAYSVGPVMCEIIPWSSLFTFQSPNWKLTIQVLKRNG